MNQKQKKKLMTDVAKGKLTMKEAEKQMAPKTLQSRKNKIGPDFIGDDPKKMREGTITPKFKFKSKKEVKK